MNPTVFPWRTYDDAHAAIAFLERAFGAERHALHAADNGSVEHAELRFGNGIVMVGSSRANMPATRGAGGPGEGVYIAIDDADAHFARAGRRRRDRHRAARPRLLAGVQRPRPRRECLALRDLS